jgi:hypothetical protein
MCAVTDALPFDVDLGSITAALTGRRRPAAGAGREGVLDNLKNRAFVSVFERI